MDGSGLGVRPLIDVGSPGAAVDLDGDALIGFAQLVDRTRDFTAHVLGAGVGIRRSMPKASMLAPTATTRPVNDTDTRMARVLLLADKGC